MTSTSNSEWPPLRLVPDATSLWARWVPRLLILSAALVILARVAAPFQVGKDQGAQLEGSLRLLAGQGLTDTYYARTAGLDITTDPVPGPTTQWPPGFSLAIAALLGCGISLITSLKLLYSVSTALGWCGWASICGKLFSELPVTGHSRILCAVPLIASILIPIFYTPLWNGTDVLLWAGVPWLVLLTNRPVDAPSGLRAAAAAGFLIGVLFAFRYASGFLGIAGGIIMLRAVMPNWKELLKRYAAFGLSSVLLAIPVVLFMGTGNTPLSDMYDLTGVASVAGLADAGDAGDASGVESSSVLSAAMLSHRAGRLIFASPLLDLLLARVHWPLLVSAAGILTVLIVILAPVLCWNVSRHRKPDFTLPLLIMPAALVVFLIGGSEGFYLGIPRYYEPVLLCWVLACVTISGNRGMVLAWGARGVLAIFLAYLCGAMPLMAVMESRRPSVVRTVLGYSPSRAAILNSTSAPVSFPSYGRLFSNKEDTRNKTVELFRQYPEALFLVQNYQMFVFDGLPGGPKPGSQIRQFPVESYMSSAFSSINRKVFVVLDANLASLPLRKWVRKVVYRNPWEKTVIGEIDVQAGQRILDAALAMPGEGE